MMHHLKFLNTDPSSNFDRCHKNTLTNELPCLSKSPFIHELTTEAVEHNSNILAKYNFDLTRLIAAHLKTELSHGLEF